MTVSLFLTQALHPLNDARIKLRRPACQSHWPASALTNTLTETSSACARHNELTRGNLAVRATTEMEKKHMYISNPEAKKARAREREDRKEARPSACHDPPVHCCARLQTRASSAARMVCAPRAHYSGVRKEPAQGFYAGSRRRGRRRTLPRGLSGWTGRVTILSPLASLLPFPSLSLSPSSFSSPNLVRCFPLSSRLHPHGTRHS